MTETVRLGFIGTGSIGRHHIRTFASQPGVTLAGVASREPGNAARTAGKMGVEKVFETAGSLIDDPGIDAVVISAPNRLHDALAVAALQTGKHVLLEKPMAIDGAAAWRIVEAQEQSGRVVLVAHQRRWTWPSLKVAEKIEAGALGDIYSARAVWRRRKGIPGWGTWFTRQAEAGGGALIDIGVHVLDQALWLMGDPWPLSVSGSVHGLLGTRRIGLGNWGKPDWDGVFDVEDYATALIRFENGAVLSLEAGWSGHGGVDDQPFVGLLGTDGGAELHGETAARLYFEREGQSVDTRIRKPLRDAGPFARQAAHFLACVRGDSRPIADARSGWRRNLIIDAVYESARTGREISLAGLQTRYDQKSVLGR